jgi:hypothetical protein
METVGARICTNIRAESRIHGGSHCSHPVKQKRECVTAIYFGEHGSATEYQSRSCHPQFIRKQKRDCFYFREHEKCDWDLIKIMPPLYIQNKSVTCFDFREHEKCEWDLIKIMPSPICKTPKSIGSTTWNNSHFPREESKHWHTVWVEVNSKSSRYPIKPEYSSSTYCNTINSRGNTVLTTAEPTNHKQNRQKKETYAKS